MTAMFRRSLESDGRARGYRGQVVEDAVGAQNKRRAPLDIAGLLAAARSRKGPSGGEQGASSLEQESFKLISLEQALIAALAKPASAAIPSSPEDSNGEAGKPEAGKTGTADRIDEGSSPASASATTGPAARIAAVPSRPAAPWMPGPLPDSEREQSRAETPVHGAPDREDGPEPGKDSAASKAPADLDGTAAPASVSGERGGDRLSFVTSASVAPGHAPPATRIRSLKHPALGEIIWLLPEWLGKGRARDLGGRAASKVALPAGLALARLKMALGGASAKRPAGLSVALAAASIIISIGGAARTPFGPSFDAGRPPAPNASFSQNPPAAEPAATQTPARPQVAAIAPPLPQTPPAPPSGAANQPARQDPAQASLAEKFGNWTLLCFGNPATRCELSNRQVNPQNNSVVFGAEIVRNKPEKADVMNVITPFGSQLTEKMRLSVDGAFSNSIGPLTCVAIGCVYQFKLSQEFLENLSQGRELNARLVSTTKQPTTFALPLGGLPDGYIRMSGILR